MAMQSESAYLYRPENPGRSMWIYFTISLILHVMMFAFIIFLPTGSSYSEIDLNRADSIDVSLVSINPEVPLPSGERSGQNAVAEAAVESATESIESEAVDTEPDPIPVKSGARKNFNTSDYQLKMPEEATKKVAKKKEVKESVKKETNDSKKVIDEAVKQVEERSENSRPATVKNRIEEMKKQVGELAYKGRTGENDAENNTGTSTAGSGSSASFTQMQIYQAEVAVEMKRNWAFSEEMAGNTQGLESCLIIKIMADGQITDVWFEKRSGNPYLDESAYKTVMKANPLPPLPEGHSKPYHLVLGFTPSGLK